MRARRGGRRAGPAPDRRRLDAPFARAPCRRSAFLLPRLDDRADRRRPADPRRDREIATALRAAHPAAYIATNGGHPMTYGRGYHHFPVAQPASHSTVTPAGTGAARVL